MISKTLQQTLAEYAKKGKVLVTYDDMHLYDTDSSELKGGILLVILAGKLGAQKTREFITVFAETLHASICTELGLSPDGGLRLNMAFGLFPFETGLAHLEKGEI